MNVVVNIYTPDKDTGCTIWINQVSGTNNYDYEFKETGVDYEDQSSGRIYNHNDDYLSLVRKVLDGRTVLRKD